MYTLVHFPFVQKHTVVKWVVKHLAYGREQQGLLASFAHKSVRRHFFLNGGKRIFARGETFQNAFHLRKVFWMRLNGAELRIVQVPERSFTRKDATPDFLSNTSTNIRRQVADVLIGNSEFKRDHEYVVGRQVCLVKCADLFESFPLKQANDSAAIIEVAGKSIELPAENRVGFAAINSANHLIENFAAWFFRALALLERADNLKSVRRNNLVQFRTLCFNRKHLTVFFLSRFAAIDEVLVHTIPIAKDLSYC